MHEGDSFSAGTLGKILRFDFQNYWSPKWFSRPFNLTFGKCPNHIISIFDQVSRAMHILMMTSDSLLGQATVSIWTGWLFMSLDTAWVWSIPA